MVGEACRWLTLVIAVSLCGACASAGEDQAVESADADADADSAGAPAVVSSAPSDGTLLFDSDGSGNFEVYRREVDGSAVQITDDPAFDSWWVRPSPDRTEILFYRTPAMVHDTDFTKTSLWRAAADGSNPIEVIAAGANGWDQHGHAEWSPDGLRFVMFAGSRVSPQIWTTDPDGADPQQVTDDGGVNLDPSWSPDGANIFYVGCPNSVCFPDNQEIYKIDAAGGDRQRLTNDDIRDHDPYLSPDGTTLAWLSQTAPVGDGLIAGIWDIRLASPDGANIRVLTTGDAVYSLPRYSSDGQTIFTHRYTPGSTAGFDLVSIDPATGAVASVVASDANEEYPSP